MLLSPTPFPPPGNGRNTGSATTGHCPRLGRSDRLRRCNKQGLKIIALMLFLPMNAAQSTPYQPDRRANWVVETLGAAVDAEIAALPKEFQAAFLRLAERIEAVGLERIGPPHIGHLEGKLW